LVIVLPEQVWLVMLCIFWSVFKVLLEIWEVEGVQVLLGRKRREKSVGLEWEREGWDLKKSYREIRRET